MLEAKNINIRVMEKEDLEIYHQWSNDLEFHGDLIFTKQVSKSLVEKRFNQGIEDPDSNSFIIEKKDGTRIGVIHHFVLNYYGFAKLTEIAYFVLPEERGKGYCTEAVFLILDYLFLAFDIQRIQAVIHTANIGSQKVVEKAGFFKEGIIRKMMFARGKHIDTILYSILREEWQKPKFIDIKK